MKLLLSEDGGGEGDRGEELSKNVDHHGFSYSSTRSVDIICVLSNFRLSSRKSQDQHKIAKTITHFTKKVFAKNLTNFVNLNTAGIENNMLSEHRHF